jgi:hypothetical protein
MQWTMPNVEAEVVTNPVGNIVAQVSTALVVGIDGGYWYFNTSSHQWQLLEQLPLPLSEIHFIESAYGFVDKDGNLWVHDGGWVNAGSPPAGPVSSESSTFGKVKAQYRPKGQKP